MSDFLGSHKLTSFSYKHFIKPKEINLPLQKLSAPTWLAHQVPFPHTGLLAGALGLTQNNKDPRKQRFTRVCLPSALGRMGLCSSPTQVLGWPQSLPLPGSLPSLFLHIRIHYSLWRIPIDLIFYLFFFFLLHLPLSDCLSFFPNCLRAWLRILHRADPIHVCHISRSNVFNITRIWTGH